MADTQRTLADMLANLFQDGQPAESITEQHMRDFCESVMIKDDVESYLFAEIFGSARRGIAST